MTANGIVVSMNRDTLPLRFWVLLSLSNVKPLKSSLLGFTDYVSEVSVKAVTLGHLKT